MAKISVDYEGELRTKSTHLQSGTTLLTDAPLDNNGKGASFSPTDLLATAYTSCMLTIIGIYCQNNKLTFQHGGGSVEKIMTDKPRRVECLKIKMDLSGNNWDSKTRKKIEVAALNCPVAKSVSTEIKIDIQFTY